MRILKSILSESKGYYLSIKNKIEKKLKKLPSGSVKERRIGSHKYYYFQYRASKKVVHKYLGKNKPQELLRQIKEQKALKVELKRVNEALKILKRSEGIKHG